MKRFLLIVLAVSGCYRDLDLAICRKNPSDPVCFADAAGDSTTDAAAESSAGDASVESAVDTFVMVDSQSVDSSSIDSSSPDSSSAETAADSAAPDSFDAAGSCADSGSATEACGKCGTRSRTCIAENTLGAWSACGGEGVCTPGEVADVTGGTACNGVLEKKTKRCTASCAWGTDACALPKGWTSIADAPAGFEGRLHSANVWTGGELFVFGGGIKSDGGEVGKKDGALYRPRTNTWELLPPFPLANGRRRHGGAWDGLAFMVWGGDDNGTTLGDGAVYDAFSKQWRTMPTAPISPRQNFASVWIPTTKRWFIWGGSDATAALKADGALFADGPGWTMLPAAPITARQLPIAAWTGVEVLVFGGHNATYLDDGALYNPTTNTWRTIPASGKKRQWSAAAADSMRFMIQGGSEQGSPVGDGSMLSLTSLSWTELPMAGSLSTARYAPSSWFDGQRLVIWSGGEVVGSDLVFRTGGFVFDVSTNAWSELSSVGAPLPRVMGNAVWGGVYAIVWGGLGQPGGGIVEPISSGAIFVPVP